MRPIQQPFPPYWYGLRGNHGPIFAASHGMNGVTLGPTKRVAGILAQFREAWVKHAEQRRLFGTPVEHPLAEVMRAMYIAESDTDAERVARPAYAQWYESLDWLWQQRRLKIPIPIPISISPNYDDARAAGTLVVGGPDTVRHELIDQVRRSLKLFSTEVMPTLAKLNA